ncbi:hypothetical protein F9B85_03015 [Heliorestis acidaminivorans]|uniref:Uncharacterized protein n=1 Tax=Heliorestis acidaminivorans TaxID=553427 RepID=A0A6I0EVK2_9FIRM|nr:hypothetical protein [Heliorestis acidaminivorans]KAB2953609.1 hypothetical protein F9B85_03015 [Heliorestis acidaminivorans]
MPIPSQVELVDFKNVAEDFLEVAIRKKEVIIKRGDHMEKKKEELLIHLEVLQRALATLEEALIQSCHSRTSI